MKHLYRIGLLVLAFSVLGAAPALAEDTKSEEQLALEKAQKDAAEAHAKEQAHSQAAAELHAQALAARKDAVALRAKATALRAEVKRLQAPPAAAATAQAQEPAETEGDAADATPEAPEEPAGPSALEILEQQAATEEAAATAKETEATALEAKDEEAQLQLFALVAASKQKDEALQAARDAMPEHGVDIYLAARCASALCFGDDKWLGIEPLVELPIAKSFAIGNSSLAQYINNHDISLQLAAGFRIWVFRDLVSFAGYLSIPLSSSGVRVEGSEFTYPGASIRRPYPGVAIGLLYDIIWIGIDHDELRNGDSSDASAYNPEYPANARVSSCTTISVALQPVTAARALFGAIQSKD